MDAEIDRLLVNVDVDVGSRRTQAAFTSSRSPGASRNPMVDRLCRAIKHRAAHRASRTYATQSLVLHEVARHRITLCGVSLPFVRAFGSGRGGLL